MSSEGLVFEGRAVARYPVGGLRDRSFGRAQTAERVTRFRSALRRNRRPPPGQRTRGVSKRCYLIGPRRKSPRSRPTISRVLSRSAPSQVHASVTELNTAVVAPKR